MQPVQVLEQQRRWQRAAGAAMIVGAGVIAVVTWLERFFGPLVEPEPTPSLVTAGAVPIHIVSFLAFILVAFAIRSIADVQPAAGRRVSVGALGVGFGYYLGVVPHTVLDFTAIPILFDELSQSQAVDLTGRTYMIIGPMAGVGLLTILVSFILLSLGSRRAGVLPRWVWISGLLVLPGMLILDGIVSLVPDAPIPHGTLAINLAIVAYGVGVRRAAAPSVHATSRDRDLVLN